ncbi:MAG: hypothetical protein NTY94_13140 [Alphaproteobacteria bacterium]|nr:hypothetical protein [Alphaproteobacteria bacterium]
MSQRRAARTPPPAPPHGGGSTVLAVAGPQAAPVARPRPALAALGLTIEGPVPLPGEYPPGTAGFRYWATAEALARVVAPWAALSAGSAPRWPAGVGPRLRVLLVGGGARQAVYQRGRLILGGRASPEAAMRALGHAVLNALRPALWDTSAAEVAAFHAGFADAAAMLAVLELPGGSDSLAQARRQAVTPFGIAFAEVMALLARPEPGGGRADPSPVGVRGARLLGDAVRRAAIAPDFLRQVAAEMALAATVREGPQHAEQLRALFARHALLPRNPSLEGYDPHAAEDGTELPAPTDALPWIATEALGLDRPLLLCPATQPPLLAAADPPAPLAAAREFARVLTAHGMVERPPIGRHQRRAPGTKPLPTHRLLDEGRALRLVRERFVVE